MVGIIRLYPAALNILWLLTGWVDVPFCVYDLLLEFNLLLGLNWDDSQALNAFFEEGLAVWLQWFFEFFFLDDRHWLFCVDDFACWASDLQFAVELLGVLEADWVVALLDWRSI